jgi:predicted Zn-dependent peptidase
MIGSYPVSPLVRWIVLTAILMMPCGLAARPFEAAGPPADLELLAPLVVERLDNGMTFLLYPNRRAPVFAGVIRVDVGGKDEHLGITGLSHMFEHMAFKGTTTVGTRDWRAEQKALARVEREAAAYDARRNELERAAMDPKRMQETLAPLKERFEAAQDGARQYVVANEFDEIYDRAGGNGENAFTSQDCTTYYINLPSDRLELWARMESDRLQRPAMREFYAERDVVMEERRMSQDSNPIGRLWELTMATAFVAHPYGYPVIGWAEDIRNLSASEARAFFETRYTPERTLGVLVGDFDVDGARRLLRETFGRIPAGGDEARHVVPEPPQDGERQARLRLAASPVLMMAWHKPNLPDPADVRAEVLGQVLTGGRAARWFEKFVKRDRLAAEIETFTAPGDAAPNLFMVYASPQGATTLDALEKAIREAVARLREDLVTEEELARAKKGLRAETVRALETNMGLAMRLAETAQVSGDPWYLERRLRQIEAVTAGELRDFARTYLIDTNLTIGRLEPPPAGDRDSGK